MWLTDVFVDDSVTEWILVREIARIRVFGPEITVLGCNIVHSTVAGPLPDDGCVLRNHDWKSLLNTRQSSDERKDTQS